MARTLRYQVATVRVPRRFISDADCDDGCLESPADPFTVYQHCDGEPDLCSSEYASPDIGSVTINLAPYIVGSACYALFYLPPGSTVEGFSGDCTIGCDSD